MLISCHMALAWKKQDGHVINTSVLVACRLDGQARWSRDQHASAGKACPRTAGLLRQRRP